FVRDLPCFDPSGSLGSLSGLQYDAPRSGRGFLPAHHTHCEEVTLRFTKSFFLSTAVALAISPVAFGSGFSIFEQGAKATAMGGAFAATADDPSAIFYNVAGIAQQRRAAFMIGGTGITFQNEFIGDPNDVFTSGTTGKYRAHTFIPPNAYLIL